MSEKNHSVSFFKLFSRRRRVTFVGRMKNHSIEVFLEDLTGGSDLEEV